MALPDEAYVLAILHLHHVWPARMRPILGTGAGRPPLRSGREVWDLVLAGRAAGIAGLDRALRTDDVAALAARWAAEAAGIDVADLWGRHHAAGITLDVLGRSGYPARLDGPDDAPPVIFRTGAEQHLTGPTVAIVGTRRCTPLGRDVAREFGAALSQGGVRVVSGLALGTDGAAHQGALDAGGAPPVGVVAGGLDMPYPARHRYLWRQVAAAGTLVTEWPLGVRSEGWHFPARNRIIVGLSDAVVVVESRGSGGSMITANMALDAGKPVLAVPGSIRNPASEGTNMLVRDGATPICDVDDIFAALSLAPRPLATDVRPQPVPAAQTVLAATGWEPTPLDVLVERTGLSPAALALQLQHLAMDGWVAGAGGWWQRLA